MRRIQKYGLGGVKGWGFVPSLPLGSPSPSRPQSPLSSPPRPLLSSPSPLPFPFFPPLPLEVDDLLANHIKHKVKKYTDGMLRGSEVSKDSYHSPVKK